MKLRPAAVSHYFEPKLPEFNRHTGKRRSYAAVEPEKEAVISPDPHGDRLFKKVERQNQKDRSKKAENETGQFRSRSIQW